MSPRTLVLGPALTSTTHWDYPPATGAPWQKVTTNDVRIARWALDLDGLAVALVEIGLYESVAQATSAIDSAIVPAVADIELAIADCFVARLKPARRGAPPKRALYRSIAQRYVRHWYPRVLDLVTAAKAHPFETEPTYRDVWAALITADEREYVPLLPREHMLFEIRTKRGATPLWELWLRRWPKLHPADKVAKHLTALDLCEELATVTRAIERHPHTRELKAMREGRRDERGHIRQVAREEETRLTTRLQSGK